MGLRNHDGGPVADEREFALLVQTRQLDLSYRRLPLSALLSLTVPVVFALLMQSLFPARTLVIWLGVLWTASLLRGLLWLHWRRTGDGTALRVKSRRLWAVTTVAALAFSVGTVTLITTAGSLETMMLAIMMFAVTAIGSTSLASHLPSACTFIGVIMVPATMGMLSKPDPVVRISGLAVIVGTVAIVATVFRAHREMAHLIRTELRLSAAVGEAVRARAAAEDASLAKSEFLANMSHELRTPLTAILGYSEMLWEDARAGGADGTAADLERVTAAGRHLLALITDVLDLSKIEAGRMELHVDAVDAGAIVRHVVDTSATLAAAGGNELQLDGLDSLGTMQSDPVKLQQVLLNLVGNACKFTSNGRVHVGCRREQVDGAEWVVVAVSDTGIGMTPEQLARIFGQFMQADSSTTRRFGGTGLGLAISQRLCQLMGGMITAQSKFGHGSTFTLKVPVLAPASAVGAGRGHGLAASYTAA